jgi:tRNA G18 (ribose-2'-O)-methylase SpoU
MDVLPVADLNDPRLASFRSMSDGVLMRERGLFVAEGRLIVERVVADARYVVDALLLNHASLDALRPSLAGLPSESVVFVCENHAFERLTGFPLHRGCLALVRRPRELLWRQAVDTARLVVVLEGVTDPDNTGGVFRNAAAFGVGAVLLSPTCCDPLYRKAVRTSMGHVLRVPFARLDPWPDTLAELRSAGFTVVALSPREPAQSLDVFAAAQGGNNRIALLIGTEGAGLTPDAVGAADVRVRIPMVSHVDSLNLAVATGIALSRLA